jgi:hypothetical protein
MHTILSPEEVSLDIQHFENQIHETEQKLENLKRTKALLEDAIVVYHLRCGHQEAA